MILGHLNVKRKKRKKKRKEKKRGSWFLNVHCTKAAKRHCEENVGVGTDCSSHSMQPPVNGCNDRSNRLLFHSQPIVCGMKDLGSRGRQ